MLDLLNRIFTPENQRIKMNEIKSHPFVTMSQSIKSIESEKSMQNLIQPTIDDSIKKDDQRSIEIEGRENESTVSQIVDTQGQKEKKQHQTQNTIQNKNTNHELKYT